MGEFQERSTAYIDTCIICGAELKGRGTKRKVTTPEGFKYKCYGKHKAKCVKNVSNTGGG